MTEDDLKLLELDIAGRLPYTPLCEWKGEQYEILGCAFGKVAIAKPFTSISGWIDIEECKLVLRSLDDMDKSEWEKYNKMIPLPHPIVEQVHNLLDFYHACHFDFRGLLDKGLANQTTKEEIPHKIRNYG